MFVVNIYGVEDQSDNMYLNHNYFTTNKLLWWRWKTSLGLDNTLMNSNV